MNSIKRHYAGLKLTVEEFTCESQILKGSKTSVKIKINSVEVEDFDSGFKTASHPNDFEEISFD